MKKYQDLDKVVFRFQLLKKKCVTLVGIDLNCFFLLLKEVRVIRGFLKQVKFICSINFTCPAVIVCTDVEKRKKWR